jgi:phosphatidylinositol alpha-1,6-mannosyltransferase
MRILMVVLNTRRIGGLENYTRQVALSLSAAGHEVKVVSALESADQVHRWGALDMVGLAPRQRVLKQLYIRTWRKRLARRLRSEEDRFDRSLVMHPFAANAALRAGLKRYWAWTYGLEVWNEWDPALRQGLGAATRLVAISESTRRSVLQRLPGKDVAVLRPAVDPMQFRVSTSAVEPTAPRRILTVARMAGNERLKGQDMVIRSLRAIERRAGASVEYWIVGEGDDRRRLERLARTCGVGNAVRFLGRVTAQELVAAYQACEVFVMPSASEGFGIAYLEASACGKPVVGSTIGGAPEAIVHGITGFCVDPDSPEEFVESAGRLLADRELAQTMGQRGRRRVEAEFTHAIFQRNVMQLMGGGISPA